MSKATPEGPPSSKQWELVPLHKVLTWSCQEAFGQDYSLVRKMREEYFRRHCPNFNNENSHDLTDIFCCMIKTAGLLSSAIYEIKEAWTGQDEWRQANDMPRTLPKGLKFFRAVSPLESPKVMGLMGIHDLDTLCHFNGLTQCPWCGKEGQNKDTIVNQLWRVYYKLGLIWKMFWLAIHHIGGHLSPQPEGLPTLRGGRSQQVILISVTTSRNCTRSISPEWEPGWRI